VRLAMADGTCLELQTPIQTAIVLQEYFDWSAPR
jgi:hypothetical protein